MRQLVTNNVAIRLKYTSGFFQDFYHYISQHNYFCCIQANGQLLFTCPEQQKTGGKNT